MSSLNFPIHISPLNDEVRLKKLKSYEVSDIPNESGFDTIIQLVTQIFNVPNAYITFVDEALIYIKTNRTDLKIKTLPKTFNLFTLAIFNESMLINDSREITQLKPFIEDKTTDFRFFASAQIKTTDGYVLGSISVSDDKPGVYAFKQLEMLQMLAALVMEKLDFRLAIRKTLGANDDRLHMLIHDLKNPMTTLSLQAELIGRMPNVNETIAMIAGKINQQSKNVVNSLNNILSTSRAENGSTKMLKTKVDLKTILDQVIANFSFQAQNKKQIIVSTVNTPIEIYGDHEKLYDIFENLINNALKYSPAEQEIKIAAEAEPQKIIVSIKDQGTGLNPEDFNRLFVKFAKLSSTPTAGEQSNGLGLSIVKMLVDLHKGKVWAESEGKNKGTTFFVELPVK